LKRCEFRPQALVGSFSQFHKYRRFNADSVLNTYLFTQLAADTILGFNQFADTEETFGVFTGVWIFEFKAIPWANMDTKVASRAEFFVDNSDRSVCRSANELAHLAELVTDRLDGADHPARTAVNANVWIDNVQHVPIASYCVNWTVG
jgi:hypothetical protein